MMEAMVLPLIMSTVEDLVYSIERAIHLYKNKKQLETIIVKMMNLNNSWEESAAKYIEVYNK